MHQLAEAEDVPIEGHPAFHLTQIDVGDDVVDGFHTGRFAVQVGCPSIPGQERTVKRRAVDE